MLSIFLKKEQDRGKVTVETLARHSGHKAWTISKHYTTKSSEYAKDQEEWTGIFKNITFKWWINFGFLESLKLGLRKVFDTMKEIVVGAEYVEKNIRLCLDEINITWGVRTVLSRPLYNKMLAIFYGTKSEKIIKKLGLLPYWFIKNVVEIAIDMSPTMEKIAREVFIYAMIVIDRFHVRFNINERIKITKNRIRTRIHKKEGKRKKRPRGRPKKWAKWSTYREKKRYSNGETKLELLKHWHYQLLKNRNARSLPEKRRWKIITSLSEMKPLVTIYNMTQELYDMYENKSMTKAEATNILIKRIARVRQRKRHIELQVIANMLESRIDYITNYFVSRHSNGFWESLNQRIRRFVFDNRWFINLDYMIFRLIKAFG